MSERKYRQRGYQDDERDRQRPQRPREQAPGPRRDRPADAPRTPNLMASHEVIRCRNCAQLVTPPIGTIARCAKCGAALHSCAQCAHFDPAARFQCSQPVPAAIFPKDAANECALFAPTVRIERQTTSSGPKDARSAFDDLFKF
jgi:hypothetical protein